ncbi:hypothetical protein ACTQ5K_16030 [Niallia sp. Sow4_A1]|uniref:Uncharacterized protein n=1 Tax=Niallia hominis TaxID=3133173 RepID=A0ABV1EYT7_9BACI|nr:MULTISPECIES: hypothetical protein [Bacillaceae]
MNKVLGLTDSYTTINKTVISLTKRGLIWKKTFVHYPAGSTGL